MRIKRFHYRGQANAVTSAALCNGINAGIRHLDLMNIAAGSEPIGV
jgi:hypothetical protein